MLTLKAFYMLRHGQTVANAEGYAAGSLDSPLTERGRQQAEAVGHTFENMGDCINLIAHSPLSRARDTAMILNRQKNLPLYENEKLSEQCFGAWRGMSWPEMRRLIEEGQNPPEGETMGGFYKRAIEGINDVLAYPCVLPLIVTHGGIFDAVWSAYNYEMIDVQNCHLYHFVPDPSDAIFPWRIFACEDDGPLQVR